MKKKLILVVTIALAIMAVFTFSSCGGVGSISQNQIDGMLDYYDSDVQNEPYQVGSMDGTLRVVDVDDGERNIEWNSSSTDCSEKDYKAVKEAMESFYGVCNGQYIIGTGSVWNEVYTGVDWLGVCINDGRITIEWHVYV